MLCYPSVAKKTFDILLSYLNYVNEGTYCYLEVALQKEPNY